MKALAHLSARCVAMLEAPVEVRIECARNIPFVLHPDGVAALEWLSYMRRYEAGRDRPRNLHIFGSAGMGKSWLLEHYASLHAPRERSAEGQLPHPVILIEGPEDGDYKKLCLRMMQCCIPDYQPPPRRQFTESCENLLAASGVRQILIDEGGNLQNAGRVSLQRTLAFLKRLSNRGFTIALATPHNDRNVLAADDQLRSRFMEWPLPHWQESEQLRIFLAGLEAHLPFPQASNLSGQRVIRWLIKRQYLVTSVIATVVRDAAVLGLQRDASRLTIELMAEVADRRCAPDSAMGEVP